MSDDTVASFLLPAISRKKTTAAFDGGRIISDGGVMLLAAAERRSGMADRLARLTADLRNLDFPPRSGGLRSERHAAMAVLTSVMFARA